MKRIVVCFDGTWNTPDENGWFDDIKEDADTNVVRFYRSILGRELRPIKGGTAKGKPRVETIKWYDAGVGSAWYEHVRGGAFGYGLSRNIREGYKVLVDHYEPGDEVYVFGFSRGAYTARSLVGLVRNAGLLQRRFAKKPDPDANPVLMDAYQLYRNRDGGPDTPFARYFRSQHSVDPTPRVRVLGVWDTVGALGIPLKAFRLFDAKAYEFHDTELSALVENAFHAVAVDEHREDYRPTLWNPRFKPTQRVEQAWFPGAHADVGGGYPRQPLSDLTLRWMQERAGLQGRGLEFDPAQQPAPGADAGVSARVSDSFGKFLLGLYGLFKSRYYRPVGATEHGNESVDPSVEEKLRRDPDYRPKNPGLRERAR